MENRAEGKIAFIVEERKSPVLDSFMKRGANTTLHVPICPSFVRSSGNIVQVVLI